jgi:hypothetical protein
LQVSPSATLNERIALAYNLSNGRVLEDPRFMICTELLHIPAPQVALPSFARTVTKCIDIARRANSFDELVRTGVPYKGRRVRINAISVLSEVMAGPKTDWIKTVENMADESYPAWRANLQATGKRLPATQTEGLERRSTWIALRPTYVKALLGWLGGSIEPSLVDKLSTRLDATLEFVTFVTQEFLLLRNYKPVKLKHITYGLITKRGQPAPVVMWSQECDRRNRAVVS